MSEKHPRWPEDGSAATFDDIVRPLCEALGRGLSLGERIYEEGIEWTGLEVGRDEQATCLLNAEALTAKQLRYSYEDQGRDWKQELLGIAVRLGIEQGRRIERTSGAAEFRRSRIKTALELLRGLE